MRKIILFIVLPLMLIALVGCGGDKEEKVVTTDRTVNPNEQVKHEEAVSYDDQVNQIITHWCGKEAEKDKPTIREVKINKTFTTADSKIILAHLNASSNLSSEKIKKNMWVKSRRMFEDFFKLPDTEEVALFWYFPIDGKDELVMKVNMTKETADKIDWEKFLFENIPDVADNYWQGFKG